MPGRVRADPDVLPRGRDDQLVDARQHLGLVHPPPLAVHVGEPLAAPDPGDARTGADKPDGGATQARHDHVVPKTGYFRPARRIVLAVAGSHNDILHVGKEVPDAHNGGEPVGKPQRARHFEVSQHQTREIQEGKEDRSAHEDDRTVLLKRIFERGWQKAAERR